MLLIWNGIGTALALYLFLFVILFFRYSILFPELPSWCLSAFFWLWLLPMPFVTLGSVLFLVEKP